MAESNPALIYHPAHYLSESGVECINIIRYLPYALATASKYVWRYRDKWAPSEDLEKAAFFVQDYENHLFKSKISDTLTHIQTVEGAKFIMSTKKRDELRTHILHLQNKARPESAFFDALYAFLQKAQHGVVSYELFNTITVSLAELRAHVGVSGTLASPVEAEAVDQKSR